MKQKYPKRWIPCVDEKVEIRRRDIFHLKHRKRPWYGFVTHVNGDYINVRPCWCKWEIELYPNEIRKI
jgi:hypothetical protein